MLGYLDGVEDGEVYGWALDLEHVDRPANVTVLVNGTPVAEAVALYNRPDVAEDSLSAGYHGFFVDLRKFCQPQERAKIHVVAHDGRNLKDSPAYHDIPALVEPPRPNVIFMHIPKTAGTALREAIDPNYRRSEVAYLYPDNTLFPGGMKLWSLPLTQRSGLRFIVGHFHFGVHNALAQPSEYITVLRNPVERTVSQYHQFLRVRPDLISDGDRLLPLCEALEMRAHISFDNLMVRYVSGVNIETHPPGQVDREVYEIALKNLQTRFSVVGFQENMSAMYAALQRRYGWNKYSELPFTNIGDWQVSDSDMAAARTALEHFNSWDVMFYRKAQELFA